MLNPNSDSYAALATKKVYEQAERKKRALYNERILEVEHGTFAPLIFSVTGGAGPETQVFIKILCDKITRKNNQSYPCVVNHSAGKHDRGPLFFTLFSFRLIRSRSTGSI